MYKTNTQAYATLLLVHGAWHSSEYWHKLLPELALRGISARTIDLPGCGASSEPLGGVVADALATRKAAEAIDGPVVLVGHSYGGVVMNEAASALKNVVHLVYLCAFMLDIGESMATISLPEERNPKVPLAIRAAEDGSSTLVPELAADLLYNGCTPEDIAYSVGRLGRQLLATRTTVLSSAPWHHLPSTYIVCTQDNILLPPLQRRMAKRATHSAELNTGHAPFISMPAALADILAQAARLPA